MKKLFNNMGMKLLSVLLAFLIWMVVINVDDPDQTKAYSVKVTALNAESMLEAGKVYDVEEGAEATVYVTAKKSVQNSLTSADFTVTADLESINDYTSVPSVPLLAACTKSGVTIRQEAMRCVPSSMKISISDKVEQTFIVSVVTSGTAADGYEVGSTRLARGDTVVIAGSETTLSKIDRVTVTADVGGLSSTTTLKERLTIYDKNGEAFNDTQMDALEIKRSDGYVLEDAEVDIRVTIWEVLSGIRLNIGLIGEPADGYHVTGVVTTPETISLAGSSTALAALKEGLDIPDLVDVTDASSGIETTFELTDYITGDLKPETDASSTVSVKVNIEKIDATTIYKPVSELTIKNQPENMSIVLTPGDKIPIEVESADSASPELDAADVQAELDLTGYQSEGTYTLPLSITLPDGYALVNDVTVMVDLKEKVAETEGLTEVESESSGEALIESESTTETESVREGL